MKKIMTKLLAVALAMNTVLFPVARAETLKLPIEGRFTNQPNGGVVRDRTKTVNGSRFTLDDGENSVIVRFQPEDGTKMEYYISLYDNTEQRYVTAGDMPGLPESMVGPVSPGKFKFTGLTGGNSYTVRIATAVNYARLTGEVLGDYAEPANETAFPAEVKGAAPVAGTFDPGPEPADGVVSRADMCVLIKDLLPREKEGVQTFSAVQYPFTDIPTEAPYKAAVDWLTELKVINGVGGGKFMPQGQITNAQAVKMLVCALGYGAYAESLGGWPEGYLTCGRELGLYGGDAPDSPATWLNVREMLATAYALPHLCMSEYTAAGKAVFYQNPDVTYAAFRE